MWLVRESSGSRGAQDADRNPFPRLSQKVLSNTFVTFVTHRSQSFCRLVQACHISCSHKATTLSPNSGCSWPECHTTQQPGARHVTVFTRLQRPLDSVSRSASVRHYNLISKACAALSGAFLKRAHRGIILLFMRAVLLGCYNLAPQDFIPLHHLRKTL